MSRNSCKFPGELLSAYVDDELDDRERARVEDHIAECDSCRARLSELQQAREIVGQMTLRQLPEGFHGQLRAQLLQKRRKRAVDHHAEDRPSRVRVLQGFASWLSPHRQRLALALVLAFLILLPISAIWSTEHITSHLQWDRARRAEPESASPQAGIQEAESPEGSIERGQESTKVSPMEPPVHLAERVRRAFTRSWSNFGASAVGVVLWLAGHIPHLIFVVALVLAVVLLAGGRGSA